MRATENLANDGGGGMHIYNSSDIILTHVTLDLNHARLGGGLCLHDSDVIITDMMIIENTADLSAGIHMGESSPTLSQVTIANNRGTDPYLSWDGSTISIKDNSNPDFTNMTIVGNKSSGLDYHGCLVHISTSQPVFTNTIFWGNNNEEGDCIGACCDSPIWDHENPISTIINYSNIEQYGDFGPVQTGEGNIASDPMFTDPQNGDYSLRIPTVINHRYMPPKILQEEEGVKEEFVFDPEI